MKIFAMPYLMLLALFSGCKEKAVDIDNHSCTEYRVQVDSISHLSYGATGDTLVLKFYGTVGTDGCCSFSRFEATEQPLQLDLALWGARSNSEVCPCVMVYLNGRQYKARLNQQGWYKIYVHQPDGTLLRDSVIVK
jgi:hypothetical protein